MDRPFPVATVASCFALAGFAVAIFAGLGAERSAADVLSAALIALTICYAVGIGAARVAAVAVREHVALARAAASNTTHGTSGTDGSDVEIIGDLPDPGTNRARSV